MNDKEYTYDIDKYTIGVDENGEDGIGMTIAIIKNGEINFLGNCYGENARCIDLLIKENQALKKQVEENKDNYNCLLKQKEQFEYIMSKQVDYQGQQKEFKKYLEDEIKDTEKTIELLSDTRSSRIPILQYKKHIIEVILAKYKEIIGGNKDEK